MDGLPKPRRYYAIVATSCGTSLAVIDGLIISVALPTIARDLNVEPSSAVLLVTVYQLVLVMSLLPLSALGIRIGLLRLYQYGQLLFLGATVLCFFAHSLPFLLVVRTLQALGAGAALSVSTGLMREIYPHKHLGRGVAIGSMVVSISSALAPAIGGQILAVASWRWLFAAAAPLAILSLLIGRGTLPASVPRDEPYDVLGAVLCALTFGLSITGLESLVQGDSPVIAATIIAAGVVVGTLFVRRELTEKSPILPVDLLARPVLALSAVAAVCAFTASMTLFLSLPFRLQQHFGFSPSEVGAMLTPWPLTVMVVAPIAGMLSDRINAAVLGGLGMATATGALLLLAFMPADASHAEIAWRMVMCGAGYGLFLAPNARLMVSAAPLERAASAGGLISTIRLTGQTLGATLLAALLAMGSGDDRTPALVAAGLTLAAGICGVARLRQLNEGR